MLATSSGVPIVPRGCMFRECSKVRSEAVIDPNALASVGRGARTNQAFHATLGRGNGFVVRKPHGRRG